MIASLKFFINKPDSSSDLTILHNIIISSFKIINLGIPNLNVFLWIAASVAYAASVNPNGIKTLLANGLSTYPIKDKPVFSKGPKRLLGNPHDYPVLCNWVFDNFILANDEPLAKALLIFETRVLVNSNICEKSFPSLVNFNDTLVYFFIPNFNLLSCY